RRSARSAKELSQDERGGCTEIDTALELGRIFCGDRECEAERHECLAAGIFQGDGWVAGERSAGRLEDVLPVATDSPVGAAAVGPVRAGEFQFHRTRAGRDDGDARTVATLLGNGR